MKKELFDKNNLVKTL